MKKILTLLTFLCLASCAIQQMSSKMEQANELMSENIQTMENSKATIDANTQEVKKSTETMQMVAIISPILLFVAIVASGFIVFKYFRKK